jgi:hypothetical protein
VPSTLRNALVLAFVVGTTGAALVPTARADQFGSGTRGVAGTIDKPKSLDWNSVDREVAILNFQSLRKYTMLLTNNATKNWQGICLGDSGGPNFFEGTNLIAAITEGTDSSPCTNLDGTARIDTPEVRSFLADFVELP